jgi:aldehyde dehydrogenase (NAD+)
MSKKAWAIEWLKSPKKLLVNGEWVDPQKRLETVNPFNLEVLAPVADASKGEVDLAVAAAARALEPWKRVSRKERAETLQKIAKAIRENAEALATLETLDNGKTYREALGDDLPESADVFDYYAGWIDKLYSENCPVEAGALNYTRREPVGVCALIVPWNFPLLLGCWKIAPALAMGNTVVVKPSPFTSLSMIRLGEILTDQKILPAGVLNIVTGGAECGEALAKHPGVAKLSFTGSTEVGKKIVQSAGASNLKTLSLELGGKCPNIFFEDAPDLQAAIDRSFTVAFSHKGEKCTEPTRFLIQKSIYATVEKALVEKAGKVKCGDPFDPTTQQGPQCHQAHFDKILSYIEVGKQEGAKLLVGGERDSEKGNAKGLFVRPTIFSNVAPSMRIAREEIFGPVLVLIPFETEAEAIQIANDSPYGLAAGFYTADVSRAMRVSNALDVGMVFVNHYGCYDFASPFGGVKQSGWGKEMAIHSLDAYTKLKSVWIRYS